MIKFMKASTMVDRGRQGSDTPKSLSPKQPWISTSKQMAPQPFTDCDFQHVMLGSEQRQSLSNHRKDLTLVSR